MIPGPLGSLDWGTVAPMPTRSSSGSEGKEFIVQQGFLGGGGGLWRVTTTEGFDSGFWGWTRQKTGVAEPVGMIFGFWCPLEVVVSSEVSWDGEWTRITGFADWIVRPSRSGVFWTQLFPVWFDVEGLVSSSMTTAWRKQVFTPPNGGSLVRLFSENIRWLLHWMWSRV